MKKMVDLLIQIILFFRNSFQLKKHDANKYSKEKKESALWQQ